MLRALSSAFNNVVQGSDERALEWTTDATLIGELCPGRRPRRENIAPDIWGWE